VFGNTLTKLRNRLGRVVLTQLSELKMHVRDEQLESDGKSRLKRRFEARAKGKGNPANTQTPVPLLLGISLFQLPHDEITQAQIIAMQQQHKPSILAHLVLVLRLHSFQLHLPMSLSPSVLVVTNP